MTHPAVTRILAIRHGETAWNVDSRIQGHLDIPLNAVGREQARRLALSVAGEDLTAIYCSDLSRAHATASAVAESVGLPLSVDKGLRERSFGAFEGLSFKEIEQRWPDQALRWRQRDPLFAAEGGENLQTFYARCVGAVRVLAERHAGEHIAVVAHGGVMDCLYRAASRLELHAPRSWELGNASINRLLYMPEGFTLVGWNDKSHLEGPALDEFSDGEREGLTT
ncbi:MAG: histidine phosphatase family protein [Burkholderiaceae bacterium]|nr:histidine phosphatase family protein [Burkholderiaceae bacterium]